jgi:hypothetical protein
MKKNKQNLILFVASFFIFFLFLEFDAHLLSSTALHACCALFGVELPPLELMPYNAPPESIDRSAWFENIIVDGKKITVGDLWGFFRQDPLLGYAPLENTISVNGWWQTNSLGARARSDIPQQIPIAQRRMLVFGDSFAVGSRIPHEEVWSVVLDSANETLEVVNFGVDGYGVAQSYLRYQGLKANLEHNIVLLMFVPSQSLWRDINIRRDLAGNWGLYWIMPRFILEDDELKLIENPFQDETQEALDEAMQDAKFREFLRTYDRFYFSWEYEDPWLLGESFLFKFSAKDYSKARKAILTNSILFPGSEARRVSGKIIETLKNEVLRDGNDFMLVFLPTRTDLKSIKENYFYRSIWQRMVSSICKGDFICLDLSDGLQKVPPEELDSGYDGTHYGPKTNELIAELIGQKLHQDGIIYTPGSR